jgi:hypothetical protein
MPTPEENESIIAQAMETPEGRTAMSQAITGYFDDRRRAINILAANGIWRPMVLYDLPEEKEALKEFDKAVNEMMETMRKHRCEANRVKS